MSSLSSLRAGTLSPVRSPTFVDVGTQPAGSTWSMIPLPPTWLGPRCLPGPNDTAATPNGCEAWESVPHTEGPQCAYSERGACGKVCGLKLKK